MKIFKTDAGAWCYSVEYELRVLDASGDAVSVDHYETLAEATSNALEAMRGEDAAAAVVERHERTCATRSDARRMVDHGDARDESTYTTCGVYGSPDALRAGSWLKTDAEVEDEARAESEALRAEVAAQRAAQAAPALAEGATTTTAEAVAQVIAQRRAAQATERDEAQAAVDAVAGGEGCDIGDLDARDLGALPTRGWWRDMPRDEQREAVVVRGQYSGGMLRVLDPSGDIYCTARTLGTALAAAAGLAHDQRGERDHGDAAPVIVMVDTPDGARVAALGDRVQSALDRYAATMTHEDAEALAEALRVPRAEATA